MRRATLCASILVLTVSTVIHSAVPKLINCQGQLTDAGGAPVADGPYSVVFTIHDAATAGASVWTETQSVNSTDGLFSVLLGSVNPILDNVFDGATRYLGIRVDADPEITPRTALVSVPYAQRVNTVDGASGGAITSGVTVGPANSLPAPSQGGQNGFVSGSSNTITGVSHFSAIVAGSSNKISSGNSSAIVGGVSNTVEGDGGIVIGGNNSSASGTLSIAAGLRAKAQHNGAFVWGDFSGAGEADSVNSSANNQITVRASGGVRFFTNTPLTTGVTLAPGGGAWATVSDSTLKENIRPVDGADILEKISRLDISRWNYETQDPSIEHIGPMAQDFYRLFGVGDNATSITTIDPDGISLAAIKALYEKNNKLESEVSELKQLVEQLLKKIK